MLDRREEFGLQSISDWGASWSVVGVVCHCLGWCGRKALTRNCLHSRERCSRTGSILVSECRWDIGDIFREPVVIRKAEFCVVCSFRIAESEALWCAYTEDLMHEIRGHFAFDVGSSI